MMEVELQATCASLGYLEDNHYQKEPDCLETVKDLIKFLKREDESCDVRRQLGEAQIVQKDLIPLVKDYKDDRILLETVIRLMVNLTQPAKLCFQNQIPEDKTNRNFYLQVESHLQTYKEAFADEAFLAVLTKKLGELLQLDFENRQEEDRMLIERLLILMRNCLHVPPNPGREQRTDDDASIHDQVLWAMHSSGMEDLLLYLASSDDERQFAFHVLEIVSLMFREQGAAQLAKAGASLTLTEKEKEERELARIREEEKAKRKATQLKMSSRHSRFGGTFTVANMKSISNKDLIYHRSLGKLEDMTFDHNKVPKRKAKNRQPISEVEVTRRSTLSIRLFLKEFCTQFLENCYNPLMHAVKDTLMRSKAQENDETYYLWAMRFFMEFNRLLDFKVDLVSETLSVQTFHYVQTHLQDYYEMMLTNKKEAIIWGRRMHLALKSYAELLHSVNQMDRSPDFKIRDSSKVLKSNVFYMMEYRDVFLLLLKKFDESRQSRGFLKDLVETTHLFLKMLEGYCKHNTHLVVQRKKKKKRAKKHNQSANAAQAVTGPSQEELEDLWDEVSSELSAIFQGREQVPDDVTPFDAASEVDVDQQRVDAMLKIQDALRGNRGGEAVALIRAAREVWSDREEFGRPDMSPEEEFMAMREIFFADLPRPAPEVPQPEEPEEEDEYPDELEEEMEQRVEMSEQEFSFKDFIARFANPQIVKAYVILFRNYKTNEPHTNHCIVKMLHRVGFDCHLVGMLFQASLFRVFQKIMFDPVCKAKHFQEIQNFSKYVVRRFFEVAQKNPKVFVELFFLKSVKDSVEITDGYGSYKANASSTKQIWTEEQDMELRQLYDQYKDTDEDGMDVVDHIMVNLIDQSKSRRQIVRQLVNLDLIGGAKEVKKMSGSSRPPREWREEEELQLREVVAECKTSDDPMTNILAQLTVKRSKAAVLKKILELGLVEDKKELYKKRKGKGGRKRKDSWGSEDDVVINRETVEDLPSDHLDSESSAGETAPSSEDSGSSDDDEDDLVPLYIKRMKKSAKKVFQQGLSEAVQWIQGVLNRTADDRDEDDDDEAIPIVPILDYQEEAMENPAFKSLLKKIGIAPPSNEQERFWRVPGHFQANQLRSRASALAPPTDQGEKQEKKKGNARYEMLKNLVKQKQTAKQDKRDRKKRRSKTKMTTQASDDKMEENLSEQGGTGSERNGPDLSSSSDDDDDDAPLVSNKSSQNVSARVSDAESDSDPDQLQIDLNPKETTPNNSQTTKRARVVESDDSDSDKEAIANSNKRARLNEESEDESQDDINTARSKQPESFPATAFTQAFSDSDSDIEDHIPLKRAVKKRVAIDSDDDD